MGLSLTDKTWIKLKSAFLRITITRVTITFFLFSFIHCFAQGFIQSFLFSVDSAHNSLTTTIVRDARVPPDEFAWLTKHDGLYKLQICKDIPHGQTPYPCSTVFDEGQSDVTPATKSRRGSRSFSDVANIGVFRNNSDPSGEVSLTMDGGGPLVHLSNQCTKVVLYADQVLSNAKREDFALVCAQFWLFAISFIGIMYDSIPHTLAVFFARVLLTGWSSYTIWRTMLIEDKFTHLISGPTSACQVDLFPSYFKMRKMLEIPDLILNVSALLLSTYLSWKLLRTYKVQSFKSLGAPPKIYRIYRYFMAVLVSLQLSVFLLFTAMGLWINQLIDSAIMLLSAHTPVYKALFIFTTILVIPWLTIGWISIRREMKWLMFGYLFLGFTFVVCWATMFYSLVYRWTFVQWPFLGCFTVASFIVMVSSLVMGTISWLNFNQGLAHFLYAEDTLASTNFEPETFSTDVEKNDSLDKSLPFDFPTLLYKNDSLDV